MGNSREDADILILGGGPAGLSAALWCVDLGLRAVIVERAPEPGGQLLWTHSPIRNYLGATAANGRELRDTFVRQVAGLDTELITNAQIESADLTDRRVRFGNGDERSASDLIIATGVRRRRLGIPGESEFVGSGVLESGVRDREQVRGKLVVVIGGGDAALENAILLSEGAERVTVVHRRQEFSAREEFIRAANANGKIEFVTEHVAEAIRGNGRVEEVSVTDRSSKTRTIECDAVLVRIGVEPNTELFRGQLALDPAGYIQVDNCCRTTTPHVFAVGDVASPTSPTISTAVGMGATAVKTIIAAM